MVSWRPQLKAQLPADPSTALRERSAQLLTHFSSPGNNFGEETAPYFTEALMVSYLKSNVIYSSGCITDSPHLEAATHLA